MYNTYYCVIIIIVLLCQKLMTSIRHSFLKKYLTQKDYLAPKLP